MNKKTSQMLTYIVLRHPRISVTGLMKLSYLSDLVHIRKGNKQISDFEYLRYKYGPFDRNIYKFLHDLIENNTVKEDAELTFQGDEFPVYEIFDENVLETLNLLEENEKNTIDEVIESLKGLGAKALTEVAYRTKPMKELNATLGGAEGLNTKLNLYAN